MEILTKRKHNNKILNRRVKPPADRLYCIWVCHYTGDNMQPHNLEYSDYITGSYVVNSHKKKLGKIESIMLDRIHGKIAYLVLSCTHFVENNKLFAVPWELFSYDHQRDCFKIHSDQKSLNISPGFDKYHWPDMSDPQWRKSIHEFYGTRQHPNHHS